MADSRKAILVLEDNHRRIEFMREALVSLPAQFDLKFWDNTRTMRRELAQWLPSTCLVSLDYDLLDSPTQNPGNGMDAVQVLAQHKPVCPVIVHTSLSDEGRTMVRTLRDRGWTAEQLLFDSREAALDWRDAVEDMVCRGFCG